MTEANEVPRPEPIESLPFPEAAPGYRPVERALLSVYYKDGVVDLARELHRGGVELYSTGGTHGAIAAAGIPVIEVSDVTRFPELMDGRVKTLHPVIHGGILGDRSKGSHLREMADNQIQPIDLVVVNLYPFEETVANTADLLEIVEKIDVGGPTMMRAGAKNFDSVASVCNPDRYQDIVAELREHGGLSQALRADCANEVFARSKAYEAAISDWFAENIDVLRTLQKEFVPEDDAEPIGQADATPSFTNDEEAKALTDQAMGG